MTKDDNPYVIHNDGKYWAIIVFLTPDAPKNKGTCFYKHKKYDIKKSYCKREFLKMYPNVTYPEIKEMSDEINEQAKQFDKWKKIVEIYNIYNRAIIFDGRRFHCSNGGFGSTNKDCRLFQTFFINQNNEFKLERLNEIIHDDNTLTKF